MGREREGKRVEGERQITVKCDKVGEMGVGEQVPIRSKLRVHTYMYIYVHTVIIYTKVKHGLARVLIPWEVLQEVE